jgi:hypothetical protein
MHNPSSVDTKEMLACLRKLKGLAANPNLTRAERHIKGQPFMYLCSYMLYAFTWQQQRALRWLPQGER